MLSRTQSESDAVDVSVAVAVADGVAVGLGVRWCTRALGGWGGAGWLCEPTATPPATTAVATAARTGCLRMDASALNMSPASRRAAAVATRRGGVRRYGWP